MSFRLWTIFYVFALVAAALATFGPGGIVAAAIVLGFWAWVFYAPKRQIGLLGILIVVIVLAMFVALLLPAVQSARGAARRAQCANNLKQISLAILTYENAKGKLPPAYLADDSGMPTHSWRVLILPYLEELVLYQKYNFNEPWDGPNNSKLVGLIPEVYRCPSQADEKAGNSTKTNYFVAVGPETAFPGGTGRSIRTITDGTSHTITVFESSGLSVNWMDPRDVTLDEAIALLTTKPRSGHMQVEDGFLTTTYYETSYRNVAYCDGHVTWMGQLKDADLAKALFTVAGREAIPNEWEETYVPPKTTTVVKWGKVWSLSVFIIVSLLPVAWVGRRGARMAGSAQQEKGGAGEQDVGVAVNAKRAI